MYLSYIFLPFPGVKTLPFPFDDASSVDSSLVLDPNSPRLTRSLGNIGADKKMSVRIVFKVRNGTFEKDLATMLIDTKEMVRLVLFPIVAATSAAA